LFKFLIGLALGQGLALSLIAFSANSPLDAKICGKDQDGPVCMQQWIASVGPAIALLFAGVGTMQLRRQLQQGQQSVTANERSQLRDEYEVLTELRDGFLDRQRELEDFTTLFATLEVKSMDDLVRLQYKFDGLYEFIGDILREPYLFEAHDKLRAFHQKAKRRMELYRRSCEKWEDGLVTNDKMTNRLLFLAYHCISDTDRLRRLVDGIIVPIGYRIAKLSGKTTRYREAASKVVGMNDRLSELASDFQVYKRLNESATLHPTRAPDDTSQTLAAVQGSSL